MICQQMLDIKASRWMAVVTSSHEIVPLLERPESVSDAPSVTLSFFSVLFFFIVVFFFIILKLFLNPTTNPRHFIQETCPCRGLVSYLPDKRRAARCGAQTNVSAELRGD